MTSLMTVNQHKNYVIKACLKSETMGKLINRIPGSRLLVSSLPGSALRTHIESLGKPRDVNKRSQSYFLILIVLCLTSQSTIFQSC